MRRSMKSSRIVASGAITRSTDEWLMSRSCQSATSSIAAMAYARMRRERPATFSERIGLRLCGIAEEPFCPTVKGFCGFRTWGPGGVAPLDREFFQRARDHRERGEEKSVAVALDDLVRD